MKYLPVFCLMYNTGKKFRNTVLCDADGFCKIF